MSFDARSRERLEALGRRLPQPLPTPAPPQQAATKATKNNSMFAPCNTCTSTPHPKSCVRSSRIKMASAVYNKTNG